MHYPPVPSLANPAPPKVKKRSTQNLRKLDPKAVRTSQHVNEFPGKELTESPGKLFCRQCQENVAVKKGVVQNHIKSKKHAESKEKLKERLARELDIAEALKDYDDETHRRGETLPIKHKVY